MKTITIKQTTPKILKFLKTTVSRVYNKVMKFDLIDGQKRSESIARRVMILLLLLLSLCILIDLLVDNGVLRTNSQRRQETSHTLAINISSPSPVLAQGDTEQVEVGNQTTENIPKVLEAPQPLVEKYVEKYGGKFTGEYLATLRKYCSEDTLKLVVAISVAETSMGKNTTRSTNWYGYFYGGDRKYDPDMETMSKVICNGISKYYSDVATNYEKAKRYTGGDNTNTWMGNVNEALSQM